MTQRRPASTAKLPAKRRSQPGSVLYVNTLASENASPAPSIRARSLRAAANNVQSQRQLHNEAVVLDRRRLFQGDPQVLIESSSDEEMDHVQSDDFSPQHGHGRVALKSHKGIVSERINTDGSDDEDSVPPQRDEEPVVANRTKTIGQRRHEVKRDKASFPLAKDACERCVWLDVQCRRPPGQNCVDCFVSGTACDVDGIITERVVDDIERGYYERQGRIQYPRLWESRELSTASSTLPVTNDRQGSPTAPSATMTTTATRILDQANAAPMPLTQHMRSITAAQMADEQQWWIAAAHRILTSGLPMMPTPLELRALASWIDGAGFRGLQMVLDVHAEAGSPSRVGRWQWIPKTPDESDEEERRSTDERSKRRRNRRNS
ncbi:unnamed protein product [Jaminaea pallidilutea]